MTDTTEAQRRRAGTRASPGCRWRAGSRARGARVRVADTRADAAARRASLRPSCPTCRSTPAPFTDATFAGVDLIAISPGVAKDQPAIAAAVARGAELVGDIELFARALPPRAEGARDHRHQRQDHGHRADRRAVPRGGPRDGRRRQHRRRRCSTRSRAIESGEPLARRVRARAVELPARDHVVARSRRRGGAQRHRGPSRPLRRHRRLRGGEGAHLRATAACRCSTATIRDRAPMRIPGRTVRDVRRRRAAVGRASGASCASTARPWLAHGGELLLPASSLALVGRHNALNALAALALASIGRARRSPRARRARRSFAGLPHRMEHDRRGGRRRCTSTIRRAQRRRDAGGARRHRAARRADRRRRRQGPGLRAAQAGGRRAMPRGAADRPRRAADRARARRHAGVTSRSCGTLDAAVDARDRARRSPATPCCCRPRARASTCSATTSSAASASRRACAPRSTEAVACVSACALRRRRLLARSRASASARKPRAHARLRRVARVGRAAAARDRPGDGVFGVDRDGRGVARTPATAPWYFLARHAMFVAVGARGRGRRVPGADAARGSRLAPWLFIAGVGAARARADPGHRQDGQRRAPLALARRRSTCSRPSS